jgi:transposase
MSTVTTIGLDIAKSVFQVHGISATGEVLIRRQVRRGQVLKFFSSLPPCLPATLPDRHRGLCECPSLVT